MGGSEVAALASGGFGGVCLTLVGAPFDLVKVRLQAHGGSALSVASSVVAGEGAFGLWRGIGPPLVSAVPTFALVSWSFAFNRRMLSTPTTAASSSSSSSSAALSPQAEAILAGGGVAPFTALIYTPVERIKVLLQVDGERVARGQPARYSGMRHCALEVLREGGLTSLYKGLAMTLLRDVPAWGAYFGVYHAAKQMLAPSGSGGVLDGSAPLSPIATFAAGALAGSATWAVCIPQDTIKTRWQSGRYASHADVIRSLLRGPGGGVVNLFRGFWTIVIGGMPRDGACLLGMEAANRALTLLAVARRSDAGGGAAIRR